jgi:hypothetical protein
MDPTAILTADNHFRDTCPKSRIPEEFFEAQANKNHFIGQLQAEYGCPIFNGGDLLDSWKCSHQLVSWLIQFLPNSMYTVAGQHELPYHNHKYYSNSALCVLQKAGTVNVIPNGLRERPAFGQKARWTGLYGLWYGGKHSDLKLGNEPYKVLLMHRYVHWGDAKHPKADPRDNARRVLRKFKEFDLIVTGDNHIPFTVTIGDRRLVNCGSMMRNNSDQKEYEPCVWLWYQQTNEVKRVYLPIQSEVWVAEGVETDPEFSFIKSLKKSEVSLDYEANLRKACKKNKVDEGTMKLLNKMIKECKHARR